MVEVFEYDPLLGYCTVKRKTVPILEVSEHGSTPPPTTTASVNLNFLQVTVSCKYHLIAIDLVLDIFLTTTTKERSCC